jgi:hypothetical protein
MPAARALTAEDRPLPALLDAAEAGPPSELEPPLSAAVCKYLMGEATPEEAAEAQAQFDERAGASPDGEFWTCGVPDEDDA